MMQQPGSMAPPPSDPHHYPAAAAPPPQYYQQPPPQPQQWMMPPQQQQPAPPVQYYQPQAAPPPMWGQQPSMVPPPQAPPVQPQPMSAVQYGAPAPAAPAPASGDEIRTLWIGDLQQWMDEGYINSIFAHTGEVRSVKLIRNKQNQQLEGYGFIEFSSHAMAEQILQSYHGQTMPNTEQTFRLNWATLSAGERRDDGPDYTVFVGDLASDVTDALLQETFKVHYPSVKGAKVVTDRATGRSKGYGFVRFGDPNEQARAMAEMNGIYCTTRQMRVGPATTKKSSMGAATQQYTMPASYPSSQGTPSDSDPNNTTIFVGGLDPNVTEDNLRQVFGTYGEMSHVKIPVGKRCGFVQYVNRSSAEEALLMLNGTLLGGHNIRLSWGRSPSSKQPQQDPNQWNGGNYYGYNQQYESYGYAPPQDPNAYAAAAAYGAYTGYPNYQQQQPNYSQQQ